MAPGSPVLVKFKVSPGQSGPLFCATGTGTGFTLIVNVIELPVQLPKLGVTVTRPEVAVVVGFVAVNAGRFPVPDAPKPIVGLLLVQA